jgi:hypothetical protein
MSGDVTPYLNMIPLANQSQPNFSAMVAAVAQAWGDTQAIEKDAVLQFFDIETASGSQLDVIGKWVGISRSLPSAITGVYFAFDTVNVGWNQGVWLGPGDPATGLINLPDDYFRLAIKTKILNNHWSGATPDAYALASVILTPLGYSLFIVDRSDLTMDLGIIGANIAPTLLQSLFTQGVINVKPIGVHITSYYFQNTAGPVFALDLNNTIFAGLDVGSFATIIPN